MDDISKYVHSPAHLAVLRQDHVALRQIVAGLPRLAEAGVVSTEAESLAAELEADQVSVVIDCRDVPGRETPLHLAVRMRDVVSAEILMDAGANWSLQNENGWSALQEAVCSREEQIAMVIARRYQGLAWAKWCRRLPRIVASTKRIRDFYMEITFHFESSVVPFIGRIAPSDTYRIWKRGANLRADMTLAGFDGFRIQRSDQTFLFLGEGYSSEEDGRVSLPRGSLVLLTHKKKEISNALEGAGKQPSESEVAREVALMSKTNMYRPGIDVTQAELVPHINWRRQEQTEMVGTWKAKVYDMLNVMVSVKSRRVPGAMADDEHFILDEDERVDNAEDHDGFNGTLSAQERAQLDLALSMGNADGNRDDEEVVECQGKGSAGSCDSSGGVKEKKTWFGWNNGGSKNQNEGCNKKLIDHQKASSSSQLQMDDKGEFRNGKDKNSKKKKKKGSTSESKSESEYKKGLRPVLWLTPHFPLTTEELLPLLDILADKVKAVRRLRELLTTKLPPGTFPVKIAIPIVPTIRVLVTFTRFEELQLAEEFSTPPSSPAHFHDARSKELDVSSSWISWMKGSRGGQSSDSDSPISKDEIDPFHIPADYTWVDANERKRRMKAKKAKRKERKQPNDVAEAFS